MLKTQRKAEPLKQGARPVEGMGWAETALKEHLFVLERILGTDMGSWNTGEGGKETKSSLGIGAWKG